MILSLIYCVSKRIPRLRPRDHIQGYAILPGDYQVVWAYKATQVGQ